MWLKLKIGQRRIRHGELTAWGRMRATLYEDCDVRDSSLILAYWGSWVCRIARPRCMQRKLVTA